MSRRSRHEPALDPGVTISSISAPLQQSRHSRRAARRFIISAWAVPVLVIGQFAMLALVPVGIALTAAWRHASLRALRPWALALAAVYATALILWALGPDRPPSLSKDLHPLTLAAIVLTALAAVAAFYVERQRSRRSA